MSVRPAYFMVEFLIDDGSDWIGFDWIGFDWIGLDWIGLDANEPAIINSHLLSIALPISFVQ